ncbi:MAG: UDP-N-acetylmuramoyl-L-alanyl-D-glutamate--2,6-diaminopimelate ligase [Roseburia sp.]
MHFEHLMEQLTYEKVQGNRNLEITGICYDSRKVKPGYLFVCISGQHTDGHDYILEAARRGAVAVVVERRILPCGLTVVLVRDTRAALARLSAAYFDYPAKKLRMIGITGTKGKTTTAFFLAAILQKAGYRTGMMGTVWIDTGREQIPSGHTTPEAYEVQYYLSQMVENGCDCCVMEVSSQGLKMQRVAEIQYEIGIFLNIGLDHIGAGEHSSFAEYLSCKRRLFSQCELGIVNCDDPNLERILYGHSCRLETFSMRYPAGVTAREEHFSMRKGSLFASFLIQVKSMQGICAAEKFQVGIPFPGRFNISNALAAAAAALHLGIRPKQIAQGLRNASVPGRCENVSPFPQYVVLVDYAHNEMSLKNLLMTLREFHPKRLIVLFGCGGNRSKYRRYRMGETAGRLADVTVLTSDNPRWEDPEKIIDDIEAGIAPTGGEYVRICDRREAVFFALRMAREGDLIVLAGKGHESYQEIRGRKYEMGEKDLVKNALDRIKKEQIMT